MRDNDQQGAQPHEIRVLTSGKALKIQPFCTSQNLLEIGRAWKEWLEDFEEETKYFEIMSIRDKVSALKIDGGPEIKKRQEIYQNQRWSPMKMTLKR